MSLLSQFSFKGRQEQAATDPNPAIAVTAGAGSGKTLSLVGRYLHLLEQGYPLRSILAITFTEKAAREMRSKIRDALARVSADSTKFHPSSFILHPSEIDSARIGTIHSLCSEILRAHPAEVGLDPAFSVLEEGLAAALQAEAIESALAWAATDQRSVALFGVFKENDLREILKSLLSRRLDISSDEDHSQYTDYTDFTDIHGINLTEIRVHPRNPACPDGFAGSNPCTEFASALTSHLAAHLDSPPWTGSLSDLTSRRSTTPDDKLELARQSVLARWDEIQQARAAQDWDAVLSCLASLRKAIDTRGGRKDTWDAVDLESVRQDMAGLKDIYDEHLKFLAEKSRWALDEQVAAHLPALRRLFDQTLREYQRRKDERQSLDFDDLEGLTAQLLSEHPDVRARWQSELRAVLVDEFQDTNERQRQIVYALTGFSAQTKNGTRTLKERVQASAENADKENIRVHPRFSASNVSQTVDLFVVGDSKQSIYKFRNADVTVFRQVQTDVQTSGGISLDLDLTFRAHRALLEGLNALLAPILGETDDPARPYAVPFAPLRAYRQAPVRENIQPPYIEFHLGLGQDAEEGRAIAASALAHRLRQLRETEGFAWGEMALLFRSSTAYAAYETALEQAGIPFVTVAGRGFYDRPEIRDLLNALAAIADPTDDLALAGLLRSPAFALPDADLYRLRFNLAPARSNREARQACTEQSRSEREGDLNLGNLRGLGGSSLLSALAASPDPAHQRAHCILNELHALAGRAPAATVLKRFLDLTGYRAVLSAAPAKYSESEGTRMTRNVDKLLADAHRSRLVNLREFLAYVQTLRDVGLREGDSVPFGEAPADPSTGSGGTVQLMTVHKAKGLEFPLVAIADAAYEHRGSAGKILLHPDLGLLLDLKDDDYHPTAWQLATRLESDRDDAEDCRLLYVAATRAEEKLLISGHVKLKKDESLNLAGWLDRLAAVAGLDEIQLSGEMSTPQTFPIKLAGLSTTLYPTSTGTASDSPLPLGDPHAGAGGPGVRSDLLEPILPAALPVADEKFHACEYDPPQRVWRVVSTTKRPRAPAWLVGHLVHEALRRWRFPGDGFEDFLRPFALESGLTDPAEIHATIQDARRLLERFRVHPLYAEMDSAERHHEVPYFLPEGRGVIDLLYRTPSGWCIADFKTDEVRSDAEALAAIRQNGYDRQVARYAEAVATQLGACTEPSRSVQAQTRLVFLNVNNRLAIFDL